MMQKPNLLHNIDELISIKEQELQLQHLYHMVEMSVFIENSYQESIITKIKNTAQDFRRDLLTKLTIGVMNTVDKFSGQAGDKRKSKYQTYLELYEWFNNNKDRFKSGDYKIKAVSINIENHIPEVSEWYMNTIHRFFSVISNFLGEVNNTPKDIILDKIESLQDETRQLFTLADAQLKKLQKDKLVKSTAVPIERVFKYFDDTAKCVNNIIDINSKIQEENESLLNKIQTNTDKLDSDMVVKVNKGLTKTFSLFNHFIIKVKSMLQYSIDYVVLQSTRMIQASTKRKFAMGLIK